MYYLRYVLLPSALLFSGLNLLLVSCHSPNKKLLEKEKGMAVTAHPQASKVAKQILKQGGNAMDAAIATQFTLAVVYPSAGNIGGGGFMVAKIDSGYYSLDYREKAPLKATSDLYQDKKGKPKPTESLKGHLASGVPGTVAGMFKAHKRFGSLPIRNLMNPAIKLAKQGFPLTERQADRLNNFIPEFKNQSTFTPSPFLKKFPWEAGDSLKQKTLARTLKRISDSGRSDFYSGKTASFIVEEMERCKGLISRKDLRRYEAKFREPLISNFRQYKIITMPPPSSGGVCLLQLLNIMEDYPIQEWGFQSTKAVHLMVEAEKRVYADRSKHLGDPDFYPVPIDSLLSEKYLTQRMAGFSMKRATPSSAIKPGYPTNKGQNTTHFSIVDEDRNAVSITTTLNTKYGSKVWVGRAGFFLNSEMNDFSIKPGYPNKYGLIGGKANAIEPGKRMLSSMTPTIVEEGDDLYMVTGSPGGSTIITTVFQTLINTTVFDMNMQEAVRKGRFHHQWKPDYIMTEFSRPLPLSTILSLYKKGQVVIPFPEIGSVDAIRVNESGKLESGADPRGDDKAMGYPD